MILSHTHKFIFICGNKVGTTSMEHALLPLQDGAEYEVSNGLYVARHIPPAVLRGLLPSQIWDQYFKFVFVRNPWDWFVSQWFFQTVGPTPDEKAPLSGRVRRRGRDLRRGLRRPGRWKQPSAAHHAPRPAEDTVLSARDIDAVFQQLRRYRAFPGRDGLYQSSWVCDMDDRMIVDYVGRYETLEDDFAEITRRLGLDLTLPRLNTTSHRDYRAYYSPEARDRVGELWSLDVTNFGYEFDPSRRPRQPDLR
jgi:hypothetical protein